MTRERISHTKESYLSQPVVAAFCDFLAEVISGRSFIGSAVHRPEASCDEEILSSTLEGAFSTYQWNGEDFDKNAECLEEIQRKIRVAIDASNADACLDAVSECLFWGLGNGAPYQHNMRWAEKNRASLPVLLARGADALASDTLKIDCFRDAVRMNSGYTKVFSLLSDDSVIYDSRVAAALGFMVASFWQQLPADRDFDFAQIAFPRVPHRAQRNRDASFWDVRSTGGDTGQSPRVYKFFPSTNNSSHKHAEANVLANWVLGDALEKTHSRGGDGARWCSASDGLRRVEAALFMIGQEVPRFSSAH